MVSNYSPLRYPGGKTKLYSIVKEILNCNNLIGGTYVEPFAGGAGIAIKLLMNNDVSKIVINDIDPAIYYFWKVILNYPDEFCECIDNTELSVDEWKKQKEIYKRENLENEIEYAFAVFYLNRTNVSGVLKGGVIGGIEQKGNYKIDARFNKEALKKKIKKIAEKRNNILLYNLDANDLICGDYLKNLKKVFINFDPPYVRKGAQLYKNSFKKEDHINLFNNIKKCRKKWIVTYDICELTKELYKKYNRAIIEINYSVKNKTKGKEYMFFSNNLIIPEELCERSIIDEV